MNTKQIVEAQEKSRFLDELMAYIIIAGGARIGTETLAQKPLGDLLDMIYPNGIKLKIDGVKTIECKLCGAKNEIPKMSSL